MRVKRTPVRRITRKVRRLPYRRRRLMLRRRLARRPRVSRFRAPLGSFPARKTVALRYVQTVSLDPSAATNAIQVFRANSIFDPDYTGTGHQPMFRDNYATIYNEYKVNHSTITMVALNTHKVNVVYSNDVSGTTVSQGQFYEANQKAVRMFIIRDVGVADYNNQLDTMIEEGNQNLVWRYCPQTTSGKMPTLRMGCWPHKLLNCSPNDSSMVTLQANNPANPCFFLCGVDQLGDGSNPDSMSFQFIITYNVTFSNLIKYQTQN